MSVHTALSLLGFSLIDTTPPGVYRHHGTGVTVYMPKHGKPAVSVGTTAFPGCVSVGDVRTLLRLLGVGVPGDDSKTPSDDHERDLIQEECALWRGLDGLALRFDFKRGGA